MSVLALATTLSLSAYPGYLPQYSQNEVREFYSVSPIIRTVDERNLVFSSITNSIYEEIGNSFYSQENTNTIMEEFDIVEDIQLKSFAKSSIKVKIKINRVEKIGITI